ncbi:hypothetical protein HPP92_022657 [Vanilla planifolia]|uniref:Uncharacterized protein n=1 Tax=Vanilla planifolia TaxID=51239 RepID=A0A835PTN7_VANPL|nr:hypothetical protein HPP92_022939 [Vanilla planifolia]KAG0459529.1 hypothetical protein HPP92_022657 [Vanilla planifolia]
MGSPDSSVTWPTVGWLLTPIFAAWDYRGLLPPSVVAHRGLLPSAVAYRGLLPSFVAYREPSTFYFGLPWPSSLLLPSGCGPSIFAVVSNTSLLPFEADV